MKITGQIKARRMWAEATEFMSGEMLGVCQSADDVVAISEREDVEPVEVAILDMRDADAIHKQIYNALMDAACFEAGLSPTPAACETLANAVVESIGLAAKGRARR
jgi:hypothetical protein